MMYMYLQKVISKKLFKKLVFCWHLGKVNDENSRIRIRIRDPDPLVRGMDPRIQIRIRIHPKISWIRNTAIQYTRRKSAKPSAKKIHKHHMPRISDRNNPQENSQTPQA
jgi:hypothetical protein